MQPKKEKKKSLWMDEAAQKALFHGLDELGEDHKDLQRLSSRKSVLDGEGNVGRGGLTTHDVTINTNKATSKSSYNTRAPDKTPSFSDLTKNITSPIPEVDEFRQHDEIRQLHDTFSVCWITNPSPTGTEMRPSSITISSGFCPSES